MEDARCGEIVVLLDQLEELIEEGKTNFLSGKVAIDKEQMIDIIRDIRLKLPTEVQQSVWIMDERNKILDQAEKEAHIIVEEAREQRQMMIERDQITEFAKERAENIIATAKADAKEMHMGAIAYAQDTCKDVEQRLKFTLESVHQEVQAFESYITDLLRDVYDNRQELKEMSVQLEQEE